MRYLHDAAWCTGTTISSAAANHALEQAYGSNASKSAVNTPRAESDVPCAELNGSSPEAVTAAQRGGLGVPEAGATRQEDGGVTFEQFETMDLLRARQLHEEQLWKLQGSKLPRSVRLRGHK